MRLRRVVVAVSDVLVLRALGVGDLATAVPALRALRREFPNARLRLATPIGLRDLVGLIGGIDDIVPTSGLRAMAVHTRPDLAVNLHAGARRARRCCAARDRAASGVIAIRASAPTARNGTSICTRSIVVRAAAAPRGARRSDGTADRTTPIGARRGCDRGPPRRGERGPPLARSSVRRRDSRNCGVRTGEPSWSPGVRGKADSSTTCAGPSDRVSRSGVRSRAGSANSPRVISHAGGGLR